MDLIRVLRYLNVATNSNITSKQIPILEDPEKPCYLLLLTNHNAETCTRYLISMLEVTISLTWRQHSVTAHSHTEYHRPEFVPKFLLFFSKELK